MPAQRVSRWWRNGSSARDPWRDSFVPTEGQTVSWNQAAFVRSAHLPRPSALAAPPAPLTVHCVSSLHAESLDNIL